MRRQHRWVLFFSIYKDFKGAVQKIKDEGMRKTAGSIRAGLYRV